MDRRRTSFVAFALGLSCVTFGSSARPLALQQISPAQAKQLVKDGKGCTMPGDVFYSRGALARNNGHRYQCLAVYGENLQPAGAAWIELEQ